jgi:hypothetical protein
MLLEGAPHIVHYGTLQIASKNASRSAQNGGSVSVLLTFAVTHGVPSIDMARGGVDTFS